jgi:ubiquinone/menaquinone biosynthesis C-methylase UbiE
MNKAPSLYARTEDLPGRLCVAGAVALIGWGSGRWRVPAAAASIGVQNVGDKEEAGKEWDSYAPGYGSEFSERMLERLLFASWRKRFLARASGKVLEIATGTGINLPYYPSSCQIIATDLSRGMLDRTRNQAKALGRRVNLCTMDAEALGVPDGSFDTIVECNSLCVFPDPIAALREMGRVCRIDGRILLLEHGRSHHRWVGRLQDWDVDVQTGIFYNCEWNRNYEDLIRQAGLSIVSIERHILGVFQLIEARRPRPEA